MSKISLQSIRVFCLTTKLHPERTKHLQQLCDICGFTPVITFGPIAADCGISPSQAGALGVASIMERALLLEEWQPFLFLEDDVSLSLIQKEEVPLSLEIPQDSDAVYLGISKCGVQRDVNVYEEKVWRYRSTSYPDFFHVWNMLSTHAILIVSKRYALAVMRAMIEAAARNDSYDTILTRLSYRFRIYAQAAPLFYQDASVGGQETPTRIDWTEATNTITDAHWDQQPAIVQSMISSSSMSPFSDLDHWLSFASDEKEKEKEKKEKVPFEKREVTVVSAYYEVRSKQGKAFYQQFAAHWKRLNCALVIYTDTETNAQWLLRDAPQGQHLIVKVVPFQRLFFASHYCAPFWNQQHDMDPEKRYHSPELYIVWNEKINFVHRCIQENPFQSSKFVWADLAYFRDSDTLPLYSDFPRADRIPENKVLFLSVFGSTPEKDPMRDYLGGGMFAGSRTSLERYHGLYHQTVTKFVEEKKFIGKDQTIINAIAYEHPEMLSIVPTQKGWAGGLWFYLAQHLCLRLEVTVACLDAGLANRMKCLASAWRTDPDARVIWPVSKHCASTLSELFDLPGCETTEEGAQTLEDLGFHVKRTNSWKLQVWETDQIPCNFATEAVRLESSQCQGRDIDLEYGRIPRGLQQIYVDLFKRFKLCSSLQRWYDAFQKKQGQEIDISVQIRTWCDCPKRRTEFFNYEAWRSKLVLFLQGWVETNKKQPNVYVTSDDARITLRIKRDLRGFANFLLFPFLEIQELNSTQRDALELYFVAKAQEVIIGSRQSTFPEVAWYLGQCQAQVIII